MHDPSHAAWDAVIDTIAYLYYTRDMGITYYSKFKDFKLPSVQMVPDLHKSLEQIKLNTTAHTLSAMARGASHPLLASWFCWPAE